ncbi:ThiJ/PfpI domain-containing protein [Streptomyces albofaciens JCM 4342]|uniref:DJ-1/PfpI family protein n=1 Tax=Streptomyces albofaciens TaxID=66866 RepID=UPI001239B713|nr:DJ-1/PfpI family protein [Streptomyces albofaciens]KAA6212072.1 ThiJ/PfpI domain-containing protein [Streptomyces albofaciens JCM 4342]
MRERRTAPEARTPGIRTTQIDSIGVLGYESVSEQDCLTPTEIFKGTAMVLNGSIAPWQREAAPRDLSVRLVALEPGVIKMQMGTNVVPDGVLSEDDLFDIFYIPGGVGSAALLSDERVQEAIRRHHEAGKVIAANCSGVGALTRSGIINGEILTSVAAIARGMRNEGFNVPENRRMWYGDPVSRIWTFTGSYGINGGAVALVAHYFGREVGTIVSMMFDTYGGIGDAIFEETGPEFYHHPELEEAFQNLFEPMLYPARTDDEL